MRRTPGAALLVVVLGLASQAPARGQVDGSRARHNVIIFVADGLRPSSVNDSDMPALSDLRARGVEFRNSYALFPTLTMPNASAIATGGRLADTGILGNTIWLGYSSFDTGNFNLAPASPVPFLENDQLLGDVDDHSGGEVMTEDTFLALARTHGYNTAAIGKVGPVAMQDLSGLSPVAGEFPPPSTTIVIDDVTGAASGVPMPARVVTQLRREGLSLEAPARSNGYGATSTYNNGYSGDNIRGGTLVANSVQQQWFTDVTTRGVLPLFAADSRTPFVLVFWSRDPDGTQHNQGDSSGTLFPGVNGATSRLAVRNADRNLGQILAWLAAHPSIDATTDVLVISDHGFATISRREVARSGRSTTSEAAKHDYLDGTGRVETEKGTLPYGFLAIDLALDLHLNLFDPDRRVLDGGRSPYKKLRLASDAWEHPAAGNGLLGDVVKKPDGSDATLIVTANGGSDLIYVPNGSAATVQSVVHALLTHDYVGGVFVADKFGQMPGALPMTAVGLSGSGGLPRPDIVVAFKVFYLNPDDLRTAIQVADTALQEGQGVHGGFGRDNTLNVMSARGPDFKTAFVDTAPVSNADLVPTLVHVLAFDVRAHGMRRGRIVREALAGGPEAPTIDTRLLVSSFDHAQTVLFFQELDGERYSQAACAPHAELENRTDASACR